MYPGHWAKVSPEGAAVVMAGSGAVVSHAELDERSIRLARVLAEAGLRPGDHLAVFAENHPRYLEVMWAGLRSGLVVTTVNRYLTAGEAGYIVDDCDARALVTTAALAPVAAEIPGLAPRCSLRLMIDGVIPGYDAYDDALAAASAEPLGAEPVGSLMLYSSGTTGRPKGVVKPTSGGSMTDGWPLAKMLGGLFGFGPDTVYLSPAPIYHAAPLGFSLSAQALGGTVVMLESFDPQGALAAVERYRVTHSQWVPTMFSRMLKLPAEVRDVYDVSSQRVVIHAAAPCPREVKEAMFAWWGPVIHEYYGGTELNGFTYAAPDAWLAHPGTVGRPLLGVIHVCGEDGAEVAAGEVGTIYFENPQRPFEYHNDEAQTKSSQHPEHPEWTTLNDVGRLDEEGYLYLADRATFMIISGGVNIYPQEIEDCLIMHPGVVDVAVIGVPNDDFGEEVKAVVQVAAGAEAGPALAGELMAWARERLASFKCPRSVDFVAELPRLPTGKLYKRVLRDPYWADKASKLV